MARGDVQAIASLGQGKFGQEDSKAPRGARIAVALPTLHPADDAARAEIAATEAARGLPRHDPFCFGGDRRFEAIRTALEG